MRISWKLIIVLVVAAAILYAVRPWLHDVAMYFYTNPLLVEGVVMWYLLHRFVLNRKKKRITVVDAAGESRTVAQPNYFSYLVLFMVFVLVGWASGILPQLHIVDEVGYATVSMLPETRENIRLMPLEVAERFSRDSLQLSQFKLGSENLAIVNGSLSWMFPLVPDGGILQFILKNKGIVYVDATTQERTSNIVFRDLGIGEGMQVTDNLEWGIYTEHYLINLDTPYYIVGDDGEIYTVVSFIEYTFHQNFGLVYTVPRWGGVLLIDSSGNIELLKPEEARASNALEGNRLYPENLARYYVETFKFEKGVINRYLIHEDQIEVRDVSFTSRQPFLMDTSDGLKWFVSAEPASESRGIFKIFLTDARTGGIEVQALPIDETLTGPARATDFVRRANPLVDWTAFKIVEPLPFVRGDTLYWKVAVIPQDSAGIAFQAFVNSRTNEVTNAETDADVLRFIGGFDLVAEDEEQTPEPGDGRDEAVAEIRERIAEIEELLDRLDR